MTNKKNPSVHTLYARNPDVWERAKRRAERDDISLSRYIEKLLREDEERSKTTTAA